VDNTLIDVVQRHAKTIPDEVALICLNAKLAEIRSLTFRQVDESARHFAAQLQDRCAPGDRAALLLDSGADFVIAFLGCLYAGVIAVPLYPLQRRRESHRRKLEAILRDADCAAVVGETERVSETADWMQQIGLTGRTRVMTPAIIEGPSTCSLPAIPAQSVAFLQYTSGSTGAPKGVCVTHHNLLANERLFASLMGNDARSVIATWLPLHHDLGLIGNALQALYLGVRAVLMDPMSFINRPLNWLEVISRYRVTISGAPNFAYALCVSRVRDAQLVGLDLSSWSCAYSGAEPIRADTVEAFARKFKDCGLKQEAMYACYGLAEATLIVTGSRKGQYVTIKAFDSAELGRGRAKVVHAQRPATNAANASVTNVNWLVSSGRVSTGQPLVIVDPISRTPCGPNELGEIWTHGPCTMAGYWRNADASAVVLASLASPSAEGPYLRTGDLGFVHDGELYVTGRIKDTIVVRGRNYAPQDIEVTAQRSCASLQPDASAAFTVEHKGLEELVLVQEVTRTALRDPHLRDAFPSIARTIAAEHGLRVHQVVLIRPGTLPKTTSGKVQRQRAKALLAANELSIVEMCMYRLGARASLSTGALAPASSDIQRTLVRIWAEILEIPEADIGIHDNFFDLGGDSLSLLQVQTRVAEVTGAAVSAVDLFACPNVASLASHLEASWSGAAPNATDTDLLPSTASYSDIAVIGLGGRFPDAANVDQLWENLRAGKCSVRAFSEEEMLAAGTPPELLNRENYVSAGIVLENIELFDAHYFGLTPREAETLDPQQRLLMECAVETLESAGYPHEAHCGPIGVFVGRGESYYTHRLIPRLNFRESVSTLISTLVGVSSAYSATQISYHLGLTGPSLTVQTACSTSLVAVHQACRAVLNGECDIALAGGVSIDVFQQSGYTYEEGSILSPDGFCRAFSADARGTVGGSGAGLVALRRLDRARAAGDTVHAIIKASAINNDGARKAGYSAPSVAGQVEVIRRALRLAAVPAETISYVEAHGTSTTLGDPIEVAALTQAYGGSGQRASRCVIGSLKANIGHLDVAAGVSGLIKVIQALKHRELPPAVNFSAPNPRIDFANSPFEVNTQLRPWPAQKSPRRAAVSAFGVGGTNAHVIVEEAPPTDSVERQVRNRLFVLSAASSTSLLQMTDRLAEHVRSNPDVDLADVAHTLQVGRRALRHRTFVVADSRDQLVEKLGHRDLLARASGEAARSCSVAFLFPGQGSQYAGMGQGLYRDNAMFRNTLDRCASLLTPMLGLDIRTFIFADKESEAAAFVSQTLLTQPSLFSVEYSLAQTWRSVGIAPSCMLGHSVGEYVAACMAGVFDLEDALATIVARARLMQDTEPGAMLAVPMDEANALALLEQTACDLAAVNGPRQCVVAGTISAVEEVQKRLRLLGTEGRLLSATRAFHSRTMQPVLDQFAARLRQVQLRAPTLPFISNVTGDWIAPEQAQDPDYWVDHLRSTVRFAAGLQKLCQDRSDILLEVGPGQTLVALVQKHREVGKRVAVPTLLKQRDDIGVLLEATGHLWTQGAVIDWSRLGSDTAARRVSLPSYPFARQRYWLPERRVESEAATEDRDHRKISDLKKWFYVPRWRLQPQSGLQRRAQVESIHMLVFSAGDSLSESVIDHLKKSGRGSVTRVTFGHEFARVSASEFCIDPNQEDDYDALIVALERDANAPLEIVHMWNVLERSADDALSAQDFIDAQPIGFTSLCYLVRALSTLDFRSNIRITVIATGLYDVTGRERLHPERATVAAICKVIPQEERRFICRVVDIVTSAHATAACIDAVAADICEELLIEQPGAVVALRGRSRWVEDYEKVALGDVQARPGNSHVLKAGGVYVITGGLGNIGFAFASLLAEKYRAQLVLLVRSKLPERGAWRVWLSEHETNDPVSRKIRRIERLEAIGGRFTILECDVADENATRVALLQAQEACGRIDGIIHTATDMSNLFVQLQELSPSAYLKQCHAKVNGLIALREIVVAQRIGLCMVTSSLSAVLGGIGLGAYAASNAFADAYVQSMSRSGDASWVTVNWDAWTFPGEDSYATKQLGSLQVAASMAGASMTAEEGVLAFERILANGVSPRTLVSVTEIQPRLQKWIRMSNTVSDMKVSNDLARSGRDDAQEGETATPHAAPSDQIEIELTGMLRDLLGLDADVHDNFFDLGGDSLVASQFIAKIRARFGVGLPIREFYGSPTVAAVAERLRNGGRTTSALANEDCSASQIEGL
jgi:acyl transferase domain-containing protein/acyl-CoA synthetase (AMP-forming)/AMP-acid ligase II/acyl carrier protein